MMVGTEGRDGWLSNTSSTDHSMDNTSHWAVSSAVSTTADHTGWTWTGSPSDVLFDVTVRPEASASEGILSPQTYKMAERVIECGFIPAVSLLGIPANIINLVVFYRQGLRDKMNLCLFSLAFVDLLYVLCMFLTTWYCPAGLLGLDLLEQKLKWYIRKHVIGFVYSFWYSSGTLTAIIAMERCVCVAMPLKAATLLKTRTMGCLVLGSVLALNALCLTYALKHYVGWDTDEAGVTTIRLKDTDVYLQNKTPFTIIDDNVLPFISFSTFFVIAFVTLVTVRKLQQAVDWRQSTASTTTSGNNNNNNNNNNSSSSMSTADKRQLALVRMLVTVSCIYIACNTPKLSLATVRFLLSDFSTSGRYSKLFFATHRAGHVFLMLNSSVNVFVYYKQSSRFRQELVKMTCCGCLTAPRHAAAAAAAGPEKAPPDSTISTISA